ncbi:hypothetical protein GCM10007342_12960 [Staphylococcus pragensis]|nr:hypothetical protein GCM10007342_12960 [Staphylococcus pragensis]
MSVETKTRPSPLGKRRNKMSNIHLRTTLQDQGSTYPPRQASQQNE